jgi:peptidoglycan/LPS O-acetylase OafA/YrhL
VPGGRSGCCRSRRPGTVNDPHQLRPVVHSPSKAFHPESRLLPLDVFRALAILGVLVYHYLARFAPPVYARDIYGYRHHYPHWLDVGALGVQFFFIISGFVIFMTLEKCRDPFDFWFRRFARIYPAFVVATFLTFTLVNAFGPVDFHSTWRDAFIGLTFLAKDIPGTVFVEPAYWSLAVEVKFYLLIGLIYAVSRGRFALGWSMLVGAGLVTYLIGENPRLHVFRWLANHVLLIECLPNFTAGIAFYKLWKGERRGWQAFALLAAINYLVVAPGRGWLVHSAEVAMMLAFASFALRKLEWLTFRPLVFVGGISYSLYLVHEYIGVSLIAILEHRLHLPDLLAALLAVFTSGALAYAMTRIIEGPAKNALLSRGSAWLRRVAVHFPNFTFATRRDGVPAAAAIRHGLSPP